MSNETIQGMDMDFGIGWTYYQIILHGATFCNALGVLEHNALQTFQNGNYYGATTLKTYQK